MKVIHLISGGDVGGAKTHVHTLLAGLTKTDQVRLVCFMSGPFSQEAQALGIPTTILEGKMNRVLTDLETLIRSEGFEIVHCHGARANLMGSLLKKRVGLPTVTTIHSDYKLDYMGRPLAALTYGTINRHALKKMDYWIGVSDVTVDMLNSRGFDPNRIYTIYNGVAIPDAPAKLTREEYLGSLGLTPEEGMTVFGIAARINPVKDMTTLVRAFAEAVKQCPKIRLVIAGDGEQRPQIQALAEELCPKGTVIFAGWVQDIQSFYSALDVNLLTSLSETFPYALTEGASWHCATVSTRVGGVPKLIEHNVNGILIEPRDVPALTDAMVRLARDPALVRTFAHRLYEKTKEEFSIQATVQRQREIYKSILRRTARAAERKRDGVLICGAYGKGNAGDDAILRAISTQLRAEDPDLPIYATSRTPKQTARDLRVGGIYTFSFGRLRRCMKKTALYLSGGGSLIQDATSSRSLWYYLYSIRTAKRTGNRVMMFSCGIGPVRRKGNCKLAARTISRCVDAVTLRDRESLAELERLGITDVPVRVTADMVFLVDPAPQARLQAFLAEQNLPEQSYLILAPRPWPTETDYSAAFAEAAVYAAGQYGLTPLLLAMEPGKDRHICNEIAALVSRQTPCFAVDAPEDPRLVVALIRQMRGVLGMRLHSLIIAAAQGVPCAGVAYDPKVSGFMSHFGLGDCCPLQEADPARLRSMIDGMLGREKDFAAASLRMRDLAEENCRIAFRLLAGDTPKLTD